MLLALIGRAQNHIAAQSAHLGLPVAATFLLPSLSQYKPRRFSEMRCLILVLILIFALHAASAARQSIHPHSCYEPLKPFQSHDGIPCSQNTIPPTATKISTTAVTALKKSSVLFSMKYP